MPRTIEVRHLCGVSEIAQTFDVSPQTVVNWRARYTDFPRPVTTLACGPIFLLPDVRKWLRASGRQ